MEGLEKRDGMMIFKMNVALKVCMCFYLVRYIVAYDSVYPCVV